jgi:acyl-CoA reductase-like NAD-dependent aldehyde dehydrogenase
MPETKAAESSIIEPKPATSSLRIKPGCEWQSVYTGLRAAAPEAFSADAGLLNLIGGTWGTPGKPRQLRTAIDGSIIGSLPMLGLDEALHAVHEASNDFRLWQRVPLAERRKRVTATLAEMRTHREALVRSLMWEIGKPQKLAAADVDRCIEGVEWYVENIEGMLHNRTPLGLVSNIASWNYPLSVLVHVVLLQALAGNSVIAKTPTDGGGYAIGACLAIARRNGLPVSLVSGPGGPLSEALVRHDLIDCLSFVGGRATGRDIAVHLVDASKRFMLEMEGVNAWGVWEFSRWDQLAAMLKKGFEYGKQRCTAYPRMVVQRTLLPDFLQMYFGVLRSLRFGNPLAVANDADPLPELDFGPVINAKKVAELEEMWSEAVTGGGMPIYRAALDPARFIAGQDTSAYFAPAALLDIPRSSKLYHNEPFGPLDSIIVVDRPEELIAEMNVSNGNLVSSLATDDAAIFRRLAGDLRAFKVGHNAIRSRGDRQEPFGGCGQSWKGCFVGGTYLVHAVTRGPGDEQLPGNFREAFRMPRELMI